MVSLNLRENVANRKKDFAPNQERKSHIFFTVLRDKHNLEYINTSDISKEQLE